MHKYVRLCKGVNDFGELLEEKDVLSAIDQDRDFYQSLYYYNQQHLEAFKKSRSVSGIKDVLTNKLFFDFDHKTDPDFARMEARTVVHRLKRAGIKDSCIQFYFSGKKGFNIVVELNRYFTPAQAKALAFKFTPDLHLDRSLYDAPQLIRIPGTRHPDSGLYKIPLTMEQFYNLTLGEIKDLATDLNNVQEIAYEVAELPNDFFEITEEVEKKVIENETVEQLFINKPKAWSNCKWLLLQGNFKDGERDQVMMILASTCRGMGYDKQLTYYTCKSALKKSWDKYGQGDFSKEELWNNIIESQIFTDRWNGGTYSCSTNDWLSHYCKGLGKYQCVNKHEDDKPSVSFDEMGKQFTSYAQNFEKNVVRTGLDELDNNVMLVSSTLNGLLGQPGAGKTSMAINYLKHTSKNDIPSMLLSMDMGLPIIFVKLIQKKRCLSFKQVMEIFKTNPKQAEQFIKEVKEEYKNVGFNFKSGLTVADIKDLVLEQQKLIGRPVKLLIIDYLECIAGPYSDSIANTGFIANQLKDLANELDICILLLLQTQKHSTPDVSDPLLTLKGVKGSSLIEQSCSTIITLWREGYNPKTTDDDRYISFAVVKNRFGNLWSSDFSWNGITGDIRSLTQEQYEDLQEFRRRKLEEKKKAAENNGGWS
jgi:hypothetical protein